MVAQATVRPESDAAPALAPESILAVIPAFNEERHIETCIRSLMEGDARLRHVPVVVADGGSTDAGADDDPSTDG